ncbi:MAG: type II toxin-antitoxin system PemK/MazF family toxin [Chthoniobacterales bacterium]
MRIIRYGIYWVSLDPTLGREQQKTRPCVVVSPDAMHQTAMAVVCPLTSKLHPHWAHRLQVVCADKPAEVMADQIRAVSLARFGAFIQKLSAPRVVQLQAILTKLYGM